MAFTVDWINRIVDSSTSIADVVAAHTELRLLEASGLGMLYPAIITYKEVDLGGGAKFPAIAFINGYQLRFPVAGSYVIKGGNLSATIVPVAGVFVERQTSAAYAVTSVGGGGSGGISQDQYLALMAAIGSRSTLTLSDIKSTASSGVAVVTQVLSADTKTTLPLTGA